MRILPLLLVAAALSIPAAAQKPPREQSPAPRDIFNGIGSGNSDAEVARVIAAASAHPLGTAENPIRVAGPEGERAYIARLRCTDGSMPMIGERAPAGVGAFGSVIAAYPVDCRAAAPGKLKLVFDMYHEENVETQLPAGFSAGR